MDLPDEIPALIKTTRKLSDTKDVKGKSRADKIKSSQKTSRSSSHDLRRQSDENALSTAAEKFAAGNKNTSSQPKPNSDSTKNASAAIVSDKTGKNLEKPSTNNIGAANPNSIQTPTTSLGQSDDLPQNDDSTLKSGADLKEDDMMETTIIHQSPIENDAVDSAQMTNAISSTPKSDQSSSDYSIT